MTKLSFFLKTKNPDSFQDLFQGFNEVSPQRGNELRENESCHALPLWRSQQERPLGNGEGEASGLQVRGVGHQLACWRCANSQVRFTRVV